MHPLRNRSRPSWKSSNVTRGEKMRTGFIEVTEGRSSLVPDLCQKLERKSKGFGGRLGPSQITLGEGFPEVLVAKGPSRQTCSREELFFFAASFKGNGNLC